MGFNPVIIFSNVNVNVGCFLSSWNLHIARRWCNVAC